MVTVWRSWQPPSVIAQEDTQPPRIVRLQVTPQQIDTANGPQVLTFTFEVEDDLSGLNDISAEFRRPETNSPSLYTSYYWWDDQPLMATVVTTVTLPQYSPYGRYELWYLNLRDQVQNQCWWYIGEEPSHANCNLEGELPYVINGPTDGPTPTPTPTATPTPDAVATAVVATLTAIAVEATPVTCKELFLPSTVR
jgi:hypothetical protein